MVEFKVDNCCGCVSLRRGAMILAILATVITLLSFIAISVQCASGDYSNFFPKDTEEQVREIYPKVAVPYAVIVFLINLSNLVGIIKSKPNLMVPYLIMSGSALACELFLILILMIAFPILLVGLIFLVPAGYLWLVIYSYYKSLALPPGQVLFKQEI